MSQIEDLQRRIMVAMERIGTGVEALGRAVPDEGGQQDGLQSALEDERIANAQLQERLKSLKDRHEQEVDALRGDLERLKGPTQAEVENEKLRQDLSDATEKLASVEAARAELAAAKAALEDTEELDALKVENDRLRAELAGREDTGPLRAELEELRQAVAHAGAVEAENSRLRAELADTERLGDLTAELEMLRAERSSHGAAMSRLDDDLQRMRKANAQLRTAVDELRTAAQDGMADAALLNQATAAELEATRAAQATDAAEARAVLARLEPLLAGAKLAEGEVE